VTCARKPALDDRQDDVLLKGGANDEASKAFLAFLKRPEARQIIESFGYSLE
jgi:molybdate transport system substrate-binding protein